MWRFTVEIDRPTAIRVDLAIDASRDPVVALVGPNGAGKSTFLRALAGFLGPEQGGLGGPPHKRPLTWVSQEPTLLPHRTLRQQIEWVAEGRLEHTLDLWPWIETLGVQGFWDAYPPSLSGGQQQRGALIRALAARPTILALDEALSQIDAPSRERITADLREWAEGRDDRLVIFTTHQFADVVHWADQVAVMNEGRVLSFSTPTNIARHPKSWGVAALVGYVARMDLAGRPQAIGLDGVSLEPPGNRVKAQVIKYQAGDLMVRLPVQEGRRVFRVQSPTPVAAGEWIAVHVRGVPIEAGEE